MERQAEGVEIPIRNVYYLLCYAWRRLEEANTIHVEAADPGDLLNLLARVLANGTRHLLRRGLDRGYIEDAGALAGLRGRVDFASSIRRNLLPNAKAWCTFDELSHDVLHNRLLKATLRRLWLSAQVSKERRDELHGLYRRMNPVQDIELRSELFSRIRLHRNNLAYGLLMDVCELIDRHWLPEEEAGPYRFRDFTRERPAMAGLFEEFVRQFYRREQRAFRVNAKSLAWQGTQGSAEALGLLPNLNTDVTLTSDARTIVIDTKYYPHALTSYRGKRMVRPDHLNQIFAYVTNVAAVEEKASHRVEGMLLYPATSEPLNICVEVHGHQVQVATVDLSRPREEIHDRLLALIS